MNKPFGKNKKRPFSPGGKPGGGFGRSNFGGHKPRPGQSERRFDEDSERPRYGDRDNRGGQQGAGFGGKKPWKPGSKPFRGKSPGQRPDSDRRDWKPSDRFDRSDRPDWKSKDNRPRRDFGDAPPWKSRSTDGPGFRRDKPAPRPFRSGPGDRTDRPHWKKDRPSHNFGPGAKPRKSYQEHDGPGYHDRGPVARRDDWNRPSAGFSKPRFDKTYTRQPDDFKSDFQPVPENPQPPLVRRTHFEPGKLLKKGDHHNAKTLVIAAEAGKELPAQPVWIYESMVDALPDGDPSAGATVFVHDQKGRFLGSAIYNPNSRIRARVFSLRRIRFDENYVSGALKEAIERRRTLGMNKGNFRLVFGESDALPGLIADKIGSHVVINPVTAAIDQHMQVIIDRLNEYAAPDGIVIRRDAHLRTREGLETTPPEILGEVPERVPVKEGDITLYANILTGQTAPISLDQRINRKAIKPFITPESHVLSLFSHVGEWALRAASFGAAEVIGVDSSRSALDLATAAAEVSGLSDRVGFVEDDAFEYLRSMEQGRLFDLIICDPPAFAKMRQHREDAARVYKSLNYLAMTRLKPGGVLVTCSSSHVFSVEDLDAALLGAAHEAGMKFQVMERRGAAPDHPVLLGYPDSEYLKCFIMKRIQ